METPALSRGFRLYGDEAKHTGIPARGDVSGLLRG